MNQGNGSQNCQASSRKMVYFAAGWNLRFAEPIIELILFELFFSHAYTPGQKEKLGYASRLFLGTHCPQRSTSCPEISDTWASKTERFFIQKYINRTYNYIRLIAANCKSLSVTFEVRDWNYAFAITFKFQIMSCQKEGQVETKDITQCVILAERSKRSRSLRFGFGFRELCDLQLYLAEF